MFGLMDLPIFQSHSTSEQEQEGFNHELLDALSDNTIFTPEFGRCKDDEDVRLPYHPLYNLRHGYSTKYIYIDPNKQKSNMRANFARYPFRIHDLDFQGEAGRSMWRIMSRQDKGVARRVGH
eukprot:GEMP01035551.1.p2 GENE.GEMP01035551.1~~GEMP01035551.1.p2  ORF type:complete len:122 (+),score=14.24 GEMP01035551.1:256-621(+)